MADPQDELHPDRRRPPFCYQTHDALDAIRAHAGRAESSVKLPMLIAVYVVLTETANRADGEAARRGGFRARRKEIAELVGVSVDTLDRYAAELERAGVLAVEKAAVDGFNLPNKWFLVDPPPSGGVAAPVRPGGSRTGAALTPKKEGREEGPPVSPPALAERPDNWPATANRKPVTEDEYRLAVAVLAAFNEHAGHDYSSRDFVASIVLRCREHPDLDLDAHRAIIASVFAGPRWWSGKPDPRIIYGNAAQFERSAANASEPLPAAPMTPSDIEAFAEGLLADGDVITLPADAVSEVERDDD